MSITRHGITVCNAYHAQYARMGWIAQGAATISCAVVGAPTTQTSTPWMRWHVLESNAAGFGDTCFVPQKQTSKARQCPRDTSHVVTVQNDHA